MYINKKVSIGSDSNGKMKIGKLEILQYFKIFESENDMNQSPTSLKLILSQENS